MQLQLQTSLSVYWNYVHRGVRIWIRWPSNANQWTSPNDPLKVAIRPITVLKLRGFWIFGLTSCKSARLNLCVIF
jgi:hypothetical protein